MDPTIILFGLLAVMLVFMFVNTRKRQKQMKEQQEQKASQTIPGAKVLLQGGLYGTVVFYDSVDLDKPAQIELAPGVVVEVHSQAILRVIEPEADVVEVDEITVIEDVADETAQPETPEQTRNRLERDSDN